MSPDLTKLVEALNKAAPTKEEFAESLAGRIAKFARLNERLISEGIKEDGHYDLALDGQTFRFTSADEGEASDTASG